MPNWEAYAEAERRGILPPAKAELFAEAKSRGLAPNLERLVPQQKLDIPPDASGPVPEYGVGDLAKDISKYAVGSAQKTLGSLTRSVDLDKARLDAPKTMQEVTGNPEMMSRLEEVVFSPDSGGVAMAGLFKGVKGAGKHLSVLTKAQEMEKAGMDMDAIRQRTGWFRAPWGEGEKGGANYLINQSAKTFSESPVGKSQPVGEIPPVDVWYHGTQSEFEGFKSKGVKRGTTDIISKLGTHFAEYESVADKFAGGLYGDASKPGRVIHARLKIENPKRYNLEGELRDDMAQWAIDNKLVDPKTLTGLEAQGGKVGYSEGIDISHKIKGSDRVRFVNGFLKHLQSQGYDGIVYGNAIEGHFGNRAAIVFDPRQIETLKKGIGGVETSSPNLGKWRFEIDDSKATYHFIDKKHGRAKLKDVIDHPTLFEDYPFLNDIPVTLSEDTKFVPGLGGHIYLKQMDSQKLISGSPEQISNLKANEARDNLKSLIHEIQHAIQEHEGFARGGSPEQFNMIEFLKIKKQFIESGIPIEEANKRTRELFKNKVGYEAYLHEAGEYESRKAAERIGKTAPERAAQAPYATGEVIPPEDLIVRMQNTQAIYTKKPIPAITGYKSNVWR